MVKQRRTKKKLEAPQGRRTPQRRAGRDEATRGTEGPHDRRSGIGRGKAESSLETTGNLAPVYRGEGDLGREGLSRSEMDVEFVNETMRTDQIQSIITRIEMV
ncbi:MAG: hypothetical protein ACK559_01910, partial [bacterium]